jgi:soluble epoxide hydrolase/lipid-phosphate phosphatase
MSAVQGSHTVKTRLLTTTDGTRYVYDYVAAKKGKSTVLLLPGFPATRHEWHYQVDKLSADGYGVIAPDLLGFGDTDRPTDLAAFRLKSMSEQLMEIVDSHKLKTVVGVAHDWGTVVLSRSLYWHSERYEKVAFVSSGYSPVGIFFNIDAINAASMAHLGYSQYGYWYFFNSYDAKGLLEDRVRAFLQVFSHVEAVTSDSEQVESAHSLFFPRDPSAWATNFAHIGAARTWLEANTIEDCAEFVTKEDKESWMEAFSRRDAFASALLCYQSLLARHTGPRRG